MVLEDLFNKYALNENLRSLALKEHEVIAKEIETILPSEDRKWMMVILDGSLKELNARKGQEQDVLERLAAWISSFKS